MLKRLFLYIVEGRTKLGQNIHTYFASTGKKYSVPQSDLSLFATYKKIMIVRDPYERLVSFYVEKIVPEQRGGTLIAGWPDSDARGLSFREFVYKLQTISPSCFQVHLESQFKNLDPTIPDIVIKMEEMTDKLPIILAELDPTLKENELRNILTHFENATPRSVGGILGRSGQNSDKSGKCWADLKPNELIGKIPFDYSVFYDSDLRDRVSVIYDNDLTAFGVCGISYN